MDNLKFEERQQFRSKWTYFIYALFAGALVLFIYADIRQIIYGKPFGDKPASDIVLVIMTLFVLAMMLLFYFSKLETIITEEAVCFRWTPLKRSFRQITWSQIATAEVIKYGFVGFGLRFTRYGTVFNVAGNKGLQLTLTTGKRIVIGTQKENELSSFLERIRTA